MQNNGIRTVPIRQQQPRRRKRGNAGFWVFLILIVLIGAVGGSIYLKKYAPTREHMPIESVYKYYHEDEVALVIDDEYIRVSDEAAAEDPEEEVSADEAGEADEEEDTDDAGEAIVRDGLLYIAQDSLKDYIDDGYVFDDIEGVMRYATASELVSVPYNKADYTVNGEAQDEDFVIVIREYDKTFVAADFAKRYSDFTYILTEDPYRALIYNALFEHETASLKRNTAIRRLGGPKSKVLEDAKKGETVSVIKNYGKWSQVVSETGVIGFVMNSRMGEVKKQTQERQLPEREYAHKTMEKPFTLGWHLITNSDANANLSRIMESGRIPDVLSPTWFRLSDSTGSIQDISSAAYVKDCHDRSVQVWALVNDFDYSDIDRAEVLNRVSNRDRLVNNLIRAALKCGVDGLNVDFEKVPLEAGDGYVQFIRELSLQCEQNDLFLSIDNYAPAAYNQYYNRSAQDDYADYVIVMAYDEHYRGGDEAGSNSSLPFVKEAVKNTLEEVEADRLLIGLPFFAREFIEEGDRLTAADYTLRQIPSYLEQHGLQPEWDETLGLHYAEYTEGDARHMLWIEDERSLAEKLSVRQENHLAGSAFWAMGFETESAWQEVKQSMAE